MNNNNLIQKTAIIFLMGIMFLGFISAFGVSTPYMEEVNGVRTFEAYKNNAEDFQVVLQSGSDEPLNVKVEILEGSEVIELLSDDNLFLVNPGEKVPVDFRILSPPGANIGDTFTVRLGFASSDVGEGALAFGTAIEKEFDVLLVEMPVYADENVEKENKAAGQAALIIFIAIVVLLILIIIVLKVKKNKRDNSMKEKASKKTVKEKSVPKKKK
jgi:hypothetical protein